ncbi:hypothetical protein JHD47_00125 [Sulfurimonas sp. SAG-AH-194-L11]|nr:ATP-binding protein [Sulfurimonas sp. SAG-AH-194-L11]MDF1876219.1 hypothetical protein [Sulfurimonas sp. SAG-AH-194-L11]
MQWIQRSFKHQIVLILFICMSLFGFGLIIKNYIDDKKQLNNILESQVMQLNNRFALSIAPKIFYNELYEISDAIFNLYEYNHKSAKDSGGLFLIKNIAVVSLDKKIIGHSHPREYFINTTYTEEFINDIQTNRESYSIEWNDTHTNLYIKTPIYASGNIAAYLYMNIDPLFLKTKEKEIFNHLFIFTSLFILLLILVSLLLSRLIDKPMKELLEGLQDLGSGKLTFEYAMKRHDEFFTLAQALHNADKRIVEQKEELLKIQLSLEDMVEERTAELNTTLDDLQKFQKQLVETEKMSALGSLVAGVAHEINTPIGVSLTGITFIESETKNVRKSLENQTLGKNALSEYFDTVVTMSESMHLSLLSAAKLVRSFKQVAIDQHTEDKRHFNLKSYFDEVLTSLHNKLKYEDVQIVNEVDTSIELFSYAGIFSQIFTNFIMNSLVHAFDDTTTNNKIVLKAWIEDGSLYLIYEDNGKGIDEDNLKKIFDPFFTTKLGKGGSGLGLNIIYNLIVHKLKGDVYCTNKDKGISMTISIPIQELEDEQYTM